jgi:hypothetical protein
MTHRLKTHYGDVEVELIFDETVHAELRIKDIVRDVIDSDSNPARLVLTTTLQTAYEWHEFIEGVIEFDANKIDAKIFGNKQEIASLTVARSD